MSNLISFIIIKLIVLSKEYSKKMSFDNAICFT